MSAWWLKKNGHAPYPIEVAGDAPAITERVDKVRIALTSRRATFTPEWTRLDADDAGVALSELVLEMADPLIERVNRLPEKLTVEFLDIAGISLLQGRSATALVAFEVLESLEESITIPSGFQLSAAGAGGDTVYFETNDTLYAAPIKVDSLATQTDAATAVFKASDDSGAAFQPFGPRPAAGAAFLIGISGTARVTESITLMFQAASSDSAPTPVSAGGVEPVRQLPVPALEWSVLDGGSYVTIEPVRDETAALTTTGLIELRPPARWRAGNPIGVKSDTPLRWLRVRLLNGLYVQSPQLSLVKANVARATAGRTVYGETLTAVAGTNRRQFTVAQRPVLPNTLMLEVEEGAADAPARDATGQAFRQWTEMGDLSLAGPEDRAFSVDGRTGTVYFGNDVNGRSVPDGFGNVRAIRYRVGGSAAEHVAAKAITGVAGALPGVVSVSNPLAASGGSDAEVDAAAIQRGPAEIRALGRAVTVADYALYAMQVQGAEVARAHAVAASHAQLPGARIPGVVSVFVVPPDRDGSLPIADAETLRSVAQHLTEGRAPAGVVVVAAVPRFQRVSVRASIDLTTAVDPTRAVVEVMRALDRYLHPLTGGDDGAGWPFGGTIRYDGLVRTVMSVQVDSRAAVRSVRTLDYKVDGRAVVGCSDWAIEPESLLWPVSHQIVDARNAP